MPLPLNSDVLQGTDPRAIPGLRVDTIRDTNGKPTPVILTRDPNTPPKLIMYCETEANLLEHHLTQEQQLRATQGAEWWAHLMEKHIQSRPASTAPTCDEVADMVRKANCGNTKPSATRPAPATHGVVNAADAEERLVEELEGASDEENPCRVAGSPGPSTSNNVALTGSPGSTGSGTQPSPGGPTGSGRRLRAQRSNPEDPPARGAKKSRTSGHKQVVPELNVLNMLRGVIEKPKVALYHRRQQVCALKKTADALTCIQEENELLALAAAEQLNPGEIARLPEPDLRTALDQVLQRIPANELPRETVLGLCRRAALMSMDSPKDFASVVWPWACRSEDIVIDFDPFDPRLSEAPLSSDLTLAEKIAWAVDFIIKDAVAAWMSTRTEQASFSLVELADVISNLAASQVV